jgi:hypothetical protein
MEPPSSDAESLGDEQPAQIRAADRLFMAADKLGDLECSHHPIWQSARLRCLTRSGIANDFYGFGFRERTPFHVLLRSNRWS